LRWAAPRAESHVRRKGEDPRDVEGHVAVPHDHRTFGGQVELEAGEVWMAVVPADELAGRPTSGQVLARNTHTRIRRRADSVDHRVVPVGQLTRVHVAADLDVAEESEFPAAWDAILREDCVHRASVHASSTVDACPRIDVQLLGLCKSGLVGRRMYTSGGTYL
jgi:hypothetical protein